MDMPDRAKGWDKLIRIVLVDDEPEITDQVAGYIARFYEKRGQGRDAYKLYVYRDGKELLQRFPSRADIIFLDIEMRDTDGMTAAAKIRKANRNVAIIFLTRLAQMAIRGYKVNALDFIVKPVDYYSFELRFVKALDWLSRFQVQKLEITPVGQGTRYLDFADLYYIEVFGRSLVFHTKEGDLTMNGRLKDMQDKLKGAPFAACNRYCLVNLHHVRGMQGGKVLVREVQIPVSRGKKEQFLARLSAYAAGMDTGGEG